MQKFTQKELNTFNHEAITKCAQNVHHEPLHKQRDSDATYWQLQQQLNGPVTLLCLSLFQFCNMLLLTSQVKVLHRLWWKSNCSCVDCGLRNKSSKFHKTSSAATQIVLKILRLFSLWTQYTTLLPFGPSLLHPWPSPFLWQPWTCNDNTRSPTPETSCNISLNLVHSMQMPHLNRFRIMLITIIHANFITDYKR